jgi:aspartyl-tRNA(Asn)/glutamyl-tRNA(Gln) amidotransferase subunit A
MSEGIDGEVKAQIMTAVRAIRDSGCVVDEVSIPSINLALAVYYIVVPAEISSNLSRYDGQRYQFSDSEAVSLEESYLRSRSKGFGAEAKRRIMIGTHVLSSGYYDAYYKRAQTVRTKLINEFKRAFEAYDVLLGPVTPDVAFKIGKNTEDPMKMYLVDIMTVSANLVGIPAISIPCGTANGMPVGLQLMMDQKKDPELLSVSQKVSELVL